MAALRYNRGHPKEAVTITKDEALRRWVQR